MLKWGIIFFLVSIVAALFGFTRLSVAAAGIARFIFFVFIVLLVIWFVMYLFGGGVRLVR